MLKNFLIGTERIESSLANIGLLLLRVFIGLTMAFQHGSGKIPPSEGFVSVIEKLHFPAPFVFAWLAGIGEFVGGILLAIGLFSRPSALMVSITMGVAAFMQHAQDPFRQKEMALLYLFAGLMFLCVGSGKYGIDAIFSNNKKRYPY
ncbi:DoxX family protein [Rapidithrix thailandica]|uniref:DoxX family protein n=1 Tax=Rapidithrix thailandica TaxID=413964 RepID=A0AAW9S0L0_9BACT